MSVPSAVGTGCLGPAHFVFVGDSMARQTFEAFLRSGGKKVPVEQLAELDALEEAAALCSAQQGVAVKLRTVRDDAGVATYVDWGATPIDEAFFGDLHDIVAGIRKRNRGAKLVFWLNALVHAWFKGDLGWTVADQRKQLQTTLITRIQTAFPQALLMWDSPSFVDLPLLEAAPAKGDAYRFEKNNASRVSADLAAADRQVMASLGVPVTLRWEVSNKYRGLQCDGLHATAHWGAHKWNCGGFPAYEELILQSGLQQLCLKHQMHLCK